MDARRRVGGTVSTGGAAPTDPARVSGDAPRVAPPLDDVERALLAQLHFAVGSWQEGLELCSPVAADARGLLLVAARARFGLGDRQGALNVVEQLLERHPHHSLGLYHKAQFLAQSGRPGDAVVALFELITHAPDFPGALQTLATLRFPGPSYRDILRRLHEVLRPRTYLEIGVEHGTTLKLAAHSEQAVGVDPTPQPGARDLPANTRLFRATSDDFFRAHGRADVFGTAPVDLAFIDGMHLFEYALRDFANVEKWCGPRSTVVLHDCLPVAKVAASRERQTKFWVGDTWKALECLLAERRDLQISVIPCQPSGLVLIHRLDPHDASLEARLPALCATYAALEYTYEAGSIPRHYPLVPNREPHLSQLMASLQPTPPVPRAGP